MPTYEYICTSCKHEFQCFVKTMNAPEPDCPKCGAPKAEKKLSVFGVSAPKAAQAPAGCQGCANSAGCPMSGGM